MRLDARKTGEALAAAAPELLRIWRGARAQANPGQVPGLLDGVLEGFLRGIGEALRHGREPAEVWPGTIGLVRVDRSPGARPGDVIAAEWRLVGEVLSAACDALEASPDAVDRVARAVEAARRGAEPLLEGRPPRGVLVVQQRDGLRRRGGG